jgi:hypothetical protein
MSERMRLCIADPPYLGRAVRWYGENGCGDGHGLNQADNHPEAAIWDEPQTHRDLVMRLEREYDGWAIAMSVHSLSTYLSVVETDSRNGIRVCVWHKPSAITSGNRVTNHWEPVLVRVPESRKGWGSGSARTSDVFSAMPPKVNFRGAKPSGWTQWVLDLLGYCEGDVVDDLFHGSGQVSEAIAGIKNKQVGLFAFDVLDKGNNEHD